MSYIFENGLFNKNNDTLKLQLDKSTFFQMQNEDNSNKFSCNISNLIMGKTYQYQYIINEKVEILNHMRSFTIIDSENMKEWFPTTDIKLYYPYSIENKMNNLFSIFDITIKKQEFKESIYSVIQLNQFKMNDFMDKINNFPDCKVDYNKN